jgi:hypothetical protein
MEAMAIVEARAEIASLRAQRRRRRRAASACFFAAGVGFGTAIYLLRARFATLGLPSKQLAFFALVALMAALFWAGARAEAEVGQLDERLRDLETQARSTDR